MACKRSGVRLPLSPLFTNKPFPVDQHIRSLILQGESINLDFKFEISDAKKIARTFSAFANTCGGRLLIGVKDNGAIKGVKTDEEAYMAELAAHLYCKPPVEFKIVTHSIESKVILEVIIDESKNKPHLAPWKEKQWKAFVRVHDQNFVANKVMFEVWKIKFQQASLLLRYDDFEQKLFSFLKNKGEITLNELVSECKIPRHIAIKILAKLIVVEIISIRITETESYYSFK